MAELYEVLRADALDIARRFDARNGTTRVSERFLARIGGAPLVDVLPLGVRSAALPQPEPAAAPVAAPVPAPATDGTALAELVRRARAARDLGHPGSDGLWAEVAARVGTADAVDPLVRVDVADHRALAAARAGAGDAAALVTAVRDGYRALGREERAALSELRLASVAAQSGAAPGEIRELLAVALRAAEALEADEPLRGRRIALAELSAIRLESYLRSLEATDAHDHGHGHGHGHGQERAHGELAAELTAFVASHAQSLPDLVAEAEEMLGRIALSEGDPERAVPLLAAAAARAIAAGRPWQAVDPLVLRAGVLMSLGRPEEAEEAARSGLAHAGELTDAEQQAVVRLTLADILLERADAAEAAELALTAAHWFDQALPQPTAAPRPGCCWRGRTRTSTATRTRPRCCGRRCRTCWNTASSRPWPYGSSWETCCANSGNRVRRRSSTCWRRSW